MVARDGLEGISIYAQHRDQIELVLLDMIMPQMGGRKVFEELRRINPSLKVLLVTGYSPEEIASELLGQGAVGLIQKPYDLKGLARAIRNALDS
jgi:CheY-like chemotaxis protein